MDSDCYLVIPFCRLGWGWTIRNKQITHNIHSHINLWLVVIQLRNLMYVRKKSQDCTVIAVPDNIHIMIVAVVELFGLDPYS